MRIGRALWRATVRGLAVLGVLVLAVVLWLESHQPLVIDRWLDVSAAPVPADAIVCIGGGTTLPGVPTESGWSRVYTAVQLFADQYAPVIVFSGRGTTSLSEAEIYADAAAWLGVPREAMILDPVPASTADHPGSLIATGRIRRSSRLLIVTSRVHSRRVLASFHKQGYTNVRVVAEYRSSTARGEMARGTKVSALPRFQSSGKSYDDVFNRLKGRSDQLLTALREATGMAWYWWKGLV